MSKNKQKKPRIEKIYGTTTHEISSLTITVNEQTGEISFEQSMKDVYSEVSYERTKGPKIVSRIPQKAKNLSFDTGQAVKNNYSYLCAVDTNTRLIQGRKVSATAVVKFTEAPPPFSVKLSADAGAYWKIDVPFCWEFVDLKTEKTENFGWLAAHEQLVRNGEVDMNTKIGMIVDSDLGKIPHFNNRTLPVFEESFLPRGIQLIYASADTGGEQFVNRALRIADSISSQTLDAIEQGKVEFNRCETPTEWYAGLRIIEAIAGARDM